MACKDGRRNNSRPKIYDAEELAKQLHDFIDANDDPQLAKFCLPREMPCRDTLNELAKNCTYLSAAITRAKAKCEIYLTGPDCKIHPKIAGIRLATNHGMAERIQQEITGKDGGDIVITVKTPE